MPERTALRRAGTSQVQVLMASKSQGLGVQLSVRAYPRPWVYYIQHSKWEMDVGGIKKTIKENKVNFKHREPF